MGNLKDYATGLVATAPSPATSGTSLVLESGQGDRFPETPFYVTAHPDDEFPDVSNAEKLLVTDVTDDTLTITRAQGETVAQSIAVGWRVSNALFFDDIDNLVATTVNVGEVLRPVEVTYDPASTTYSLDTLTGGAVDVLTTYGLGDDNSTDDILMPFDFFTLNGVQATNFYINENGRITLEDDNDNELLTFDATNLDLGSHQAGTLKYEVFGTTPNQRLVIEWAGVHTLGDNGDPDYEMTFQVKFFETSNNIELHVDNTGINIFLEPNIYVNSTSENLFPSTVDWTPTVNDLAERWTYIETEATAYETDPNQAVLEEAIVKSIVVGHPEETEELVETVVTTPSYSFDTLTGGATDITADVIAGTAVVPFTFTFPFGSETFTQINSIGSFGNLELDGDNLDDVTLYDGTLDPSTSGTISYEEFGSMPNRRMVVQYDGVSLEGTADTITAQIKFFEEGYIEVHIDEYDNTVTENFIYTYISSDYDGDINAPWYDNNDPLDDVAVRFSYTTTPPHDFIPSYGNAYIPIGGGITVRPDGYGIRIVDDGEGGWYIDAGPEDGSFTDGVPINAAYDPFGGNYVTQSGSFQLTNKYIVPRVSSTSSTSSLSPSKSSADEYVITALSTGLTINSPGSANNGDKLLFAFKDNGTTRSLDWNAIFVDMTGQLPTDTVAGKWLYVGTRYNSNTSTWHVIGVVQEP